MVWLADSVFSIREAATHNLKRLTEVFGVAWADKHILPKVHELHKHHNYLYRMTTLFAVSVRVLCLLCPVETDLRRWALSSDKN